MKILRTFHSTRVSTILSKKSEYKDGITSGKGLLFEILSALHLVFLSRSYRAVIVTSDRKDNLFVIFSNFWPGKKPSVFMIDCLWYKPKENYRFWLKKIQLKLLAMRVRKFIVWSSHEIHDYACTFSIPKEKFQFIPHHHTLEGYDFDVSDGNYIFSGGDGDRDYSTLMEAVKGLGVRVVIATRRQDWLNKTNLPSEIMLIPCTHDDFRKWMAGAKIVVVPMKKGLLHSGGQQTYLNAMAMGKPVIVADDKGAVDYIHHGLNGLIVPAGDAQALRKAIMDLIKNQDLKEGLSFNAKRAYRYFSTARCMEKIIEAAEGRG